MPSRPVMYGLYPAALHIAVITLVTGVEPLNENGDDGLFCRSAFAVAVIVSAEFGAEFMFAIDDVMNPVNIAVSPTNICMLIFSELLPNNP